MRALQENVLRLATAIVFFTIGLSWSVGPSGAQETRRFTNSPVVIVEFGDYQCPFCGRMSSTLQLLKTIYQDDIRLEFRHFPLPFHSDSALAHQAALAAGGQGKFWEMNDLLFSNQQALKREHLIAYAVSLGIDQEKFVADMDSMKFRSIVEKDLAEGMRLGVSGTPTFFINGKQYSGVLPLATFQSIIDNQLIEAGIKTPAQLLARACTRGPETSPVILTVFADFQSPISAQTAWTLEEILSLYPEKIRLVFRHFPLETHTGAMLAHEAALAAAQQGKFWEMHDLLFSGQADFRLEKLLGFARGLGLDDSKFAQALADHRFATFISHELAEGKSLGVRGVPTMLINDRRVDGLEPVSVLRLIIDEELRKATSSGHTEAAGRLHNPLEMER